MPLPTTATALCPTTAPAAPPSPFRPPVCAHIQQSTSPNTPKTQAPRGRGRARGGEGQPSLGMRDGFA